MKPEDQAFFSTAVGRSSPGGVKQTKLTFCQQAQSLRAMPKRMHRLTQHRGIAATDQWQTLVRLRCVVLGEPKAHCATFPRLLSPSLCTTFSTNSALACSQRATRRGTHTCTNPTDQASVRIQHAARAPNLTNRQKDATRTKKRAPERMNDGRKGVRIGKSPEWVWRNGPRNEDMDNMGANV